MAKGTLCPNCKKMTLHSDGNYMRCGNCDYVAQINPNLGKGFLCPKCKTWTVRNGKCSRCTLIVKSE